MTTDVCRWVPGQRGSGRWWGETSSTKILMRFCSSGRKVSVSRRAKAKHWWKTRLDPFADAAFDHMPTAFDG